MNAQDKSKHEVELNEFEAEIEVVNIGIWLYENGYFKDRKLLAWWLFYTIIPIFIVLNLALGTYFEVEFPSYILN